MAIIRRTQTSGFTVVPNETLDDPRICMRSKGLLSYLLGRPEDWVVHVSHLATIGEDGKTAIYTCIKKLVAAGYIEKVQHRNEDGSFGELEYIVSPTSETRFTATLEPHSGKPHTVAPYAGKPPLQKKERTKERSNKPQTPKPSPKPTQETPEENPVVCPVEQKPEPPTPPDRHETHPDTQEPKPTATTSDSTRGYTATDEDRRIYDLPLENKKQPIPQNQRMQIEEWMALWRKHMRKHWPAGQNQRAIHVLRYWTRAEIEAAFETLHRADYPGWAYLRSIFQNQAGDQVNTGKNRELEAFLSTPSTPTTQIDDISKYL